VHSDNHVRFVGRNHDPDANAANLANIAPPPLLISIMVDRIEDDGRDIGSRNSISTGAILGVSCESHAHLRA